MATLFYLRVVMKRQKKRMQNELQKTLNAEGFLNEKDKTTFRFREMIHQLQHDNISSILPKI